MPAAASSRARACTGRGSAAQQDEAVDREQEAREIAEQGRVGELGAQDALVPGGEVGGEEQAAGGDRRDQRPAGKRPPRALPPAHPGEEGQRQRQPPEAGRHRPDVGEPHHPRPGRQEQIGEDQRRKGEAGRGGVIDFVLQPRFSRTAAFPPGGPPCRLRPTRSRPGVRLSEGVGLRQLPDDLGSRRALLLADHPPFARAESEMDDAAAGLEDQLVELEVAVAQAAGAFERRQAGMAEVAGKALRIGPKSASRPPPC